MKQKGRITDDISQYRRNFNIEIFGSISIICPNFKLVLSPNKVFFGVTFDPA